jgi:hypothetical protein
MSAIWIAVQAIAFPIGRSIAGWAGIALQDGEITWPEWRLLTETIIRVGIIEAAIYYGVSVAGIDIPILAAGGAAFLADKIIGAIKDTR